MTSAGLSHDTDRRLVELLLARSLVDPASIRLATQQKSRPESRGRSVAEILCDLGALDRVVAAALLREVRAGPGRAPAPARPAPTAAARDPSGLGPGARLGSYRILALLGRGGMGVVYRARDERLKRDVALKTMSGLSDAEAVERFVREARAAGRLHHPGIVAVHDAGVEGGVPFMALELVEGPTLAQRIASGGPLSPNVAATLVRDVALAVEAAHDAGIVHRDLKPANVLLDAAQRPRLTDFGLARDSEATGITASGDALGTPAFMAPEQALAKNDAIGPRTDVYGLGAILYTALAGRPPHEGPSGMAVLRKVIEEEPASISRVRVQRGLAAVPRDLETVCFRALEKAPPQRYPSAQELARDLERFLAGEPVAASPAGLARRAWRVVRRNRALALAALTLSLSLGGMLVRARADRARGIARLRGEAIAAVASFDAERAHVYYDTRSERADLGASAFASGTLALVKASELRREAGPGTPGDPDPNTVALAVADVALLLDRWDLAAQSLDSVREEWRSPSLVSRLAVTREGADWFVVHGRDVESLTLLVERSLSNASLVEAELYATAAIEIDRPGRIGLLRLYRALARERLGNLRGVVDDVNALLRIQPRSPGALALQANAHDGLGDVPAALAAYASALALDPDCETALVKRARLFVVQGRFAEALADSARLEAMNPLDALTVQVDVARRTGSFQSVIRACDRLLAQRPDATLFAVRGDARQQESDIEGALADVSRAIELEPRLANAWFVRGDLRLRRGERSEAVASYRRFLELANPGDRRVAPLRARLAELEQK